MATQISPSILALLRTDEYWSDSFLEEDNKLELLCFLRELDEIWKEHKSGHRWWDTYTKVVQLQDRFLQFTDAQTTGDTSAIDAGWEWDGIVTEVFPHTTTIVTTVYKTTPGDSNA